jgi:predicted PurR-regulated permease PerM
MPEPRKFERGLGWIILALLLGGCVLIMKPFVSALLWAVVLSIALWPLHRRLVQAFRGRRGLATMVVAAGLVLIILLPFVTVGVTIGDNVQELSAAAKRWLESGPPEPPSWLGKLPVVGPKAVVRWKEFADDSSKFLESAKRFLQPVTLWLLKAGLGLAQGLLELGLSIIIACIVMRQGTGVADRLLASAERIAGPRGRHLLEVASNTVRGVVYGILGTAFFQAVLAAIGFIIAGVPAVPLLALLTFVLCVIPAVGAPLVWIPAVIWLFNQGATGYAIFLIIWGIGVSSVDNFVKPWLISHGSNMPFILIFFGVLGGALTFGFIGLFIGPTLLAVGYKLVEEWFATRPALDPIPEKA